MLDYLILALFAASLGCFAYAGFIGFKINKKFTRIGGMVVKGKVVSVRYGKYDLSDENFKDKLIEDILKDDDK